MDPLGFTAGQDLAAWRGFAIIKPGDVTYSPPREDPNGVAPSTANWREGLMKKGDRVVFWA